MELVIDIPEEDYRRMLEKRMFGRVDIWKTAIQNGTPLPKGHGRLIDTDVLEPDTEWDDRTDGYTAYSQLQIDCAETIIEAERESEHENA